MSEWMEWEIMSKVLKHFGRRERQVLLMTIEGLTDQEIANALRISRATVRTYTSRLRTKLGALTRTHLGALATEIDLDADARLC